MQFFKTCFRPCKLAILVKINAKKCTIPSQNYNKFFLRRGYGPVPRRHPRWGGDTLPKSQHPRRLTPRCLRHLDTCSTCAPIPKFWIRPWLWHCWLGHFTRKNPSPIWHVMCLGGGGQTLLNFNFNLVLCKQKCNSMHPYNSDDRLNILNTKMQQRRGRDIW